MSTRTVAKAVLSSLIPVVAMWGVAAVPAGAQVTGPGPIDSVDHFPIAYGFKIPGGSMANLKQCVPGSFGIPANSPNCGLVPTPNPTQPISAFNNFPTEVFYWLANAKSSVNGVQGLLVLSTQATFSSGSVVDGQQITFSRIRIRVSGVTAGAWYKVTHPYGVGLNGSPYLQADSKKGINVTTNYGCAAVTAPACDFAALTTPSNPLSRGILSWDSGAPIGFLGDGATAHQVTGSPYGTNVFKVERVNPTTGVVIGAPVINQPLFTVVGAIQ